MTDTDIDTLTFDEYSEAADATAKGLAREDTASAKSIPFLALAVNGEAGELAEKVKKSQREADAGNYEEADRYLREAEGELGDVLWYLDRLAASLGTTLNDAALENIAKLTDRDERGEIFGDGDDR